MGKGTVNLVTLIGRLGRDPELKYTQGGTAYCRFSIATDEQWTDKSGERHERTEWHSIVTWDRLAEPCGKHLAKGSRVFIQGSITSRKWTGRDGNERTAVEIRASDVLFLDSPTAKANGNREQRKPDNESRQPWTDGPVTDHDIPF